MNFSPCDFQHTVLLLQKTLLQSSGVKSKLKHPDQVRMRQGDRAELVNLGRSSERLNSGGWWPPEKGIHLCQI